MLLRLSKRIIDSKDRFTLVDSFLMSCFNYCPIVWHFCNKLLTWKLEKLYERGLRFATKDYDSDYTELLKTNDKCTFSLIRLKKIMIFVYDCVNNIHADYLNKMYKLKNNEYSMRDNMIVNVPRFNTVRFGKMSLRYSGAKLWNSVPIILKEPCNNFKEKLGKWKCENKMCTKCADFIFHE